MSHDPDIARALGYPYPAPTGDFIWRGGKVTPFDVELSLEDRTPVLAVGSNRAPEQLLRKFGETAIVPVTVAHLMDHDVVYSAHMASYGSIPATLAPSPGTLVTVSLTWLTDTQLQRMHETEAVGVNYDYGESEALSIDLGPRRPTGPIGCYLGRRGALGVNGAPVALLEIDATARSYKALGQSEILNQVHDGFSNGQNVDAEDFDSWLSSLIRDRAARQEVTETLTKQSIPIDLATFKRLDMAPLT
jgi:hypothetical protein